MSFSTGSAAWIRCPSTCAWWTANRRTRSLRKAAPATCSSSASLTGRAAVEDSARRLPEEVMLHAGGAVLILPRTGRFDAVGDKVLVAWDGGREAAFSVRGALPLLRRASQVTLVSAVHAKGAGAARCCREAENWLRRHGIEAAVEQRAGCADFADSLLGCASMAAADLIVMGGYGHARSRERLLGGVTRDVLARACVPVLMAH